MRPCSHDILNYTKTTRGCLGHTVRKKQLIDTVCARGDSIEQNRLVPAI